ncbi:hypothetical protein BKA93DRAFT_820356 [Sparassis latifolia]
MSAGCPVHDNVRVNGSSVQAWTGVHFHRATLKQLGLRMQLGHKPGVQCPNPVWAFGDDFVVVDLSGIHEVGLDFCRCETAQSHPVQLLQTRMFPAMSVDLKTAAMFRLLETFHVISAQSKISRYEFYTALAQRTDNTGVDPPKMLKRAGHGHDLGGVVSTLPGSCTVLCPACPHPGKNLPANWANVPKDKSWLYRLFLSIDANFWLKRKKVSSDQVDPGLNHGYAYFVEEKAYKQHLHTYDKVFPDDISTCNNHDVLKLVSMKGVHQGTVASSVGTVDCACHNMKRPCSVGDLQKGERYVNMDYIFWSTVGQHSQHGTNDIVESYDIVCQWSKNIWNHFKHYGLPSGLINRDFTFVILKFHLPVHQEPCRVTYSFNLLRWVARTDGEGVERGHASHNPYASSTKKMGPGSHCDILDNAFGDYNWRKICHTACTFLAKVKTAVQEQCEHVATFRDFNTVMTAELSAEGGKDMVEAWEIDSTALNPFVVTRPTVTLAGARLQLAEEEAASLKMSASMMINGGLDLEKQQWHFHVDVAALGQHATELQCMKIQERCNVLQWKIEAWYGIQRLYMLGVDVVHAHAATSRDTPFPVQDMPLLLPSAVQGQMVCSLTLMEVEWRLHQFMRGQRENTCARTTIQTVEDKVTGDATCYRMTFTALVALARPLAKVGWQAELCPLNATDVREMTEALSEESEVWMAPGAGRMDCSNMISSALQIKWCKARECQLLEEEMQRALAFHDWMASWWLDQAE